MCETCFSGRSLAISFVNVSVGTDTVAVSDSLVYAVPPLLIPRRSRAPLKQRSFVYKDSHDTPSRSGMLPSETDRAARAEGVAPPHTASTSPVGENFWMRRVP
jgi:hypothetical protein